ncbi:hypothetical protein [Curtobacterium sp. MCBA15_004]|uniref:hypothetical protein n=1 Tax=unclassified Curtobacterium TaxID=257496 RepID=UPI000AA53983|nr:hypothetical protein [Curtobacterium sp. MCBA15_004]WIA96322.1 hypothetical protein QOL16_14625 [Curtobacterium sp. MCBA15_004]
MSNDERAGGPETRRPAHGPDTTDAPDSADAPDTAGFARAGNGTDADATADAPDSVASRAAAAEALPLDQRADAFAALHDELRTRLESGSAHRA